MDATLRLVCYFIARKRVQVIEENQSVSPAFLCRGLDVMIRQSRRMSPLVDFSDLARCPT
jgi:hypothetical protein